MKSKGTRVAKESLMLALHRLSELEDTNKEVEDACDNIRDVLDQLCHHCHNDLKIFGKIPDFGKRV